MAEIHAATSGDLVRELVEAVRAEAEVWTGDAVSQAGGIYTGSARAAARFAIEHLLSDLDDHLGIRLAVILATYKITADGSAT